MPGIVTGMLAGNAVGYALAAAVENVLGNAMEKNWEIGILDSLQNIHTPWLDKIMVAITSLGNAGILWIVLAAVLLIIPRTRKAGLCIAIALILDLLITNCLLKNLVARTRPYDVANFTNLIVKKPTDYSFPSGHTAASFAAVTALFMRKEKLLGSIACVVAVLIAFSRMYLYVHFPTDILGGIVVGIASGVAAGLILKVIDTKLATRNEKSDMGNQ